MPPITAPVVSNREEDSMNNEPSLSGKTIIGLIYPPPDIRTIVDKTASFVARNGIDFENKIREKESNNSRFNFLSNTDPYHAYYRKKVIEFAEGKVETSKVQVPDAVKEVVKKAEFIPHKPPPAFEFSHDPSTINSYELDLIRMTALFVARNGRQFLTQLMTREARNYQFDFLKPAHASFTYFTKLVEQYTKVVVPPNNIVKQLQEEATNRKKLVEDIKYRVAWEKHQKGLRDKEEAEAEKERQAYAQIDWHDFVVVQTVDFQPGDSSNLPPLCTPKDVGARILLEARAEQQKASAEAVEMDMEESDSDEERDIENEAVPQPTFAAPLPPTKDKNVIVRDYDPKKASGGKLKPSEKWLISPLTGERIPSDKLDEHVRYNTVASQYKEDRERHLGERSTEEPVLALGADISKNLGQFAERRTDIFGVGSQGAEQTVIGRKLGEDDEAQQANHKLIWDGTEETREAITKAVQNNITIDQQIHDLHRAHGYLPDPNKEKIGAKPPAVLITQGVAGSSAPPRMPIPPPPMARPSTTMMPLNVPEPGGPPSKRARTEEDLEPEDVWLQKIHGQVEILLQLPVAQEFGLDGSIVGFQADPAAPVGDLKQKIQERFNFPSSKQKLMYDGFFLKDNCSPAFYNMTKQSLVILQVKERGGKKK
ncbi:unnamed protein product [Caenorhabditis auriculariae]|uniref:Uncharacterized protein n=1 Tax=Caenorhabditis auriculariae TaxID=2777116 RepID=A0A8S1H632_9PELO|nr:unnamed protein product [Caenorhabditis auriculariae]